MSKRLFDIVVSAIVLMLALLFMVPIVLLIKLDSKGPAIFTQKRIGLDGQLFDIYKFRSMVVDASGSGAYFTVSGDPRITRVGRIIRKTSIDELPQLFNVLKGNMSLVGPRPNSPQQKGDYTEDEWEKRNSVRPGVTGLSQAVLRSAATLEERTRLDLEYVEKMSVVYDIWLIMLTFKQLFVGRSN